MILLMQWQSPGSESQGDEPEPEAWDAHDPRRQKDQFAPPSEPCECYCLHCGRTFMSDQIWLQKIIGGREGMDGFWMCPTPNCSGAGFTFDIFPTDPDHPANEGWVEFDDEELEEEFWESEAAEESNKEYDPQEPQYKSMDELSGDNDDLEGEEWKLGLKPGERPEPPEAPEQDDEEKRYNEPDERPRELDWTNNPDAQGSINDDDIPF